MKILITGSVGFIGYHTCLNFCKKKYQVVGIDNINNYYSTNLKKERFSILSKYSNFKFYKVDIADKKKISSIFKSEYFDCVIHLAAQAGVQYSISNPEAYVNSNLVGFHNILYECVQNNIEHLIYASSSSVYGSNKLIPFNENHNCSDPISFYAATKLSNELMAKSYSKIYGLMTTGLRFFTVYGPYGRPDMSPLIFANSIMNEKIINIYNNGNLKRDFTYIDDAIKAIDLVFKYRNKKKNLLKKSCLYNVANNNPVKIMDFLKLLEKFLNKSARINYLPLLKGDVIETYGDISAISKDFGYRPKILIEDGVKKFISWYKEKHQLSFMKI